MEFNIRTSELNVSPEERDLLTKLGVALDKLSDKDKENIENILAFNLSSANNKAFVEEIRRSLASNLSIYLEISCSAIFLNIISQTYLLENFLNKLNEEKILSSKSKPFLLNLSAKYGIFLRAITRQIDNPLKWMRIRSNILLDDDNVYIQTKITRNDSELFIFNIPLENTLIFANHFVQRTLDVCKKTDREHILEISEGQINTLAEKIEELKIFYQTVKNETDITITSDKNKNTE
ncbi:hypothetical protein [Methanoregula sp. UBA64]|jgi:hypothetical protein|uniref:hypothetical protein n=1 Tax=Methanoregula sp. UBA64 TaxID=1915554 RepID=UPI0025DE5AB9|nr:hypothetical protein [Methanoregula sp. UBA64]